MKRPKLTEKRFDQWAEQLAEWIQESVSPFPEETTESQEKRKARAIQDKLFFMQTYLPHYFTAEFGDFQEEWTDLSDIRDEAVFIAAPREHAKSTIFSFGIPLHDICFAQRHFILLISDTNDQATGFTVPIRAELEDNQRIRHDFGDLTAKYGTRLLQWKKNDFVTSNGVRILARGSGEKVRGLKHRQYRPDRAIIDDFENDQNVMNPKQVQKGKEWLLKAAIGSLGEGYSFTMVGNLFHPKSVLSQFIAEKDENGEKLHISRIYQAILDPGKKDERPLWGAAWTMERLLKKKRVMGTRAFNAEMMNLVSDEDSPFREEWFRYYSRYQIIIPNLVIASFIDPSAKKGESNDYKAIITVGLDRHLMIFHCLHAWIRRATVGEMFAAAYAQHDTYGGMMGIEENMFKDFLHEAIQNYARQMSRYLPWKAVHHTTNKEARIIGTLSYLVEHGKLIFEKGHSDQALLVDQLIYILNKNVEDDGPDALEGSVSLLQTSGGPIEYESVSKGRFGNKGAY